jgi:hypothetical protein
MRLLVAIVSAALTVWVAGAGAATPKIAGTTLDGKRLSIAQLRGKPVIVNVWSSW